MTEETSPKLSRLYAIGFLAFVTVFTLSGAANYLNALAPLGNDCSAHLALAKHVSTLIETGNSDFFWGASNLGLPLYAAYQPLPSVVTGFLMYLLDGIIDPVFLFKFLLVMLWVGLPWSWYIGARWLGATRAHALLLALLILAPRDSLSLGVGLTTFAHTGLVTQLWGLFCFPLALGAVERSVVRRDMHVISTAFILVLTAMSHLFFGLLVGIAILVRIAVRPKLLQTSWRPLVTCSLLALIFGAFWLLPVITTSQFRGGLPWTTPEYAGWSFNALTRALLSGDVFDYDRWPWLTICVFSGLVWAVQQNANSHVARSLILFGLICGALAGGQTTWGEGYQWLPLHRDVNPSRYVLGLQLAGIGLASYWITTWSIWKRQRWAVFIAIGIAVVYAADRRTHASQVLSSFNHKDPAFTAVADHLSQSPQHRFAVDHELGTASHFYRDLLPMLAKRAQLQSYALGYHATHATYYAEYIKYEAMWMRLFNVGELVARNEGGPIKGRFPITFQAPPFTVFGVPGASDWGYFELLTKGPSLKGDLRKLRPIIKNSSVDAFRRGYVIPLKSEPKYHLETSQKDDFMNSVKGLSTRTPSGKIVKESRTETSYHASVVADSSAWALLKVNYFPYWTAHIDGKPVEILHVAPNFMAIPIPAGSHEIAFVYKNPFIQKLSALVFLLLLLSWVAYSLRTKIVHQFRLHDVRTSQ